MASKKQGSDMVTNAFVIFDEVIKQYLESVPEQVPAPQIDPPGGEKQEIKPLPFNPAGGV